MNYENAMNSCFWLFTSLSIGGIIWHFRRTKPFSLISRTAKIKPIGETTTNIKSLTLPANQHRLAPLSVRQASKLTLPLQQSKTSQITQPATVEGLPVFATGPALKKLLTAFPSDLLNDIVHWHLKEAIHSLEKQEPQNFYVSFALRYLKKGDVYAVISIFLDNIQRYLDHSQPNKLKASMEFCFAASFMLVKDTKKSLYYYTKATTLSETNESAWIMKGKLHFIEKELTSAHRAYLRAYTLSLKKGARTVQIQALQGLIEIHEIEQDYKKIQTLCYQGIKCTSLVQYEDKLALFYSFLARSFGALDHQSSEIYYYKKALSLHSKHDNLKKIGLIYHELGQSFLRKKKWQLTLRCLEKSLQFHQRIQSISGMADNYHQIGKLYLDQYANLGHITSKQKPSCLGFPSKNFMSVAHSKKGSKIYLEKALHYYQQTLRLEKIINQRVRMAKLFCSFGNFYWVASQNPRAIDHYYQAIRIFSSEKSTLYQAQALENVGIIHHTQQEVVEAQGAYSQSMALYQNVNNQAGVYRIKEHLKDINLKATTIRTM